MVTTVGSSSTVVFGSSLLFTTSSVFPGLEAVAVAVFITVSYTHLTLPTKLEV